jgi:hypothetical protein
MNSKKSSIGQSLTEFGLLIPFVLLLILGFLDLGRAIFFYSSVSNSVREGTRYAIVNFDHSNLEQIVKDNSFGIHPEDLDIDIDNPSDEQISITATYYFVPLIPGLDRLFGSPGGIKLEAQSTMRISGAYR